MSAHTLGEEQFCGYVHLWRATSRTGRIETIVPEHSFA